MVGQRCLFQCVGPCSARICLGCEDENCSVSSLGLRMWARCHNHKEGCMHMSGKHIVMLHDIGTACVSIKVEQTGTDLFKKMAKVTTVL